MARSPEQIAVLKERGRANYRMRGNGWTHETHGYRFRIKVYVCDPKKGADNATICVDGGYSGMRWMYSGTEHSLWSFCGDMYGGDPDYRPGPHLGKLVRPDAITDTLRSDILKRLESGWD